MIGYKPLDLMSFLLACDVVWMGLLAYYCSVLLTSVGLLLLLALPVLLDRAQMSLAVIATVLEIVI